MKALVLEGPNRPFDLKDVPDPVAGPGEAVARVITCGAGLTIQHVKAGRVPANFPLIIGHEIAAEIVEIGPGHDFGLSVGDGVTAHFYLTCGHCRWCLADRESLCENSPGVIGRAVDGGYAEYIKLPARSFVKFPESLDYKARPAEAGVAADALATPVKVLRRARVRPGEWVAVFGAGGGVGIHQVMMGAYANARVIAVDTKPEKFAACEKAGAEICIDGGRNDVVEAIIEASGGGADVAIDYVSSRRTLEAGFKSLGVGGRLVTLGGAGQDFEVNAMSFLAGEREVLGSRFCTRGELAAALELAGRGEVRPLVTEVRPMEEANELHDLVEAGDVTGRAVIRVADA